MPASTYIKVTSVSGGTSGWNCSFSIWQSQLSSLTNTPTQSLTYPGTIAYIQGTDPVDACLTAIESESMFSNITNIIQ